MVIFFIFLIPLLIALVHKKIYGKEITYVELGIQVVVPAIITIIVLIVSQYSGVADREFINGKVVSKSRINDSYEEAYQCMCVTDSNGFTTCSTCYRTVYTSDWIINTTIGKITLDEESSYSRSVYSIPDPKIYNEVIIGEACSRENTYTNYIKYAPESLFNFKYGSLSYEELSKTVPPYPVLHSKYKVNRVLLAGHKYGTIPTKEWNLALEKYVPMIGTKKQANVLLMFVNNSDQSYRHIVEKKWLGGKKNDVIVLIGTTNYPKIDWVDTITLGKNSGNELMTVKMRDSIMSQGSVDIEQTTKTISDVILSHFDRKPMEDFAYLENEYDPPTWLLVTAFILNILISLIIGAVVSRNNLRQYDRYR